MLYRNFSASDLRPNRIFRRNTRILDRKWLSQISAAANSSGFSWISLFFDVHKAEVEIYEIKNFFLPESYSCAWELWPSTDPGPRCCPREYLFISISVDVNGDNCWMGSVMSVYYKALLNVYCSRVFHLHFLHEHFLVLWTLKKYLWPMYHNF